MIIVRWQVRAAVDDCVVLSLVFILRLLFRKSLREAMHAQITSRKDRVSAFLQQLHNATSERGLKTA